MRAVLRAGKWVGSHQHGYVFGRSTHFWPGPALSAGRSLAALLLASLAFASAPVATARATLPLPDEGATGQLIPAAITVGDTQVVAQLTGAGSLNHTDRWGVHGTDLGHTFRFGGELRIVFGDTFGPQGRDWRSNAMAWTSDFDPSDGLRFDGMVTDRDQHAKELLASRKLAEVEVTVIPTYGVAVGERMFLHYMSVRRWGPPGRWVVGHSGLAFSDDRGRTWVKDPNVVWPEGSNFAQVAMVPRDGFVYLFGIPAGRFGGVKLARVPEGSLLDVQAYSYWNGLAWVRGDERAATTIVAAPVGELSVHWSPYHRLWLMTYLNHQRDAIVLRAAPLLVGPWDQERVLTAALDRQLYAPYLLPDQEGPDIYFTISRFDLYNVFLMRARVTHMLDGVPALTAGR